MDIHKLLKKLRYKEELKGTIVNAPEYISFEFNSYGFSTTLKKDSRFTILFVKNKTEFKKHIRSTIKKLEYDSLFWICYPKGTSKIETDVNRDILWEEAKPYGYRPVSQVAIDSDWSAMRFRPIEKVKGK
jgi:hypothetical protein